VDFLSLVTSGGGEKGIGSIVGGGRFIRRTFRGEEAEGGIYFDISPRKRKGKEDAAPKP